MEPASRVAFWRELFARWVLLLLVIAPFAIFLPRILLASSPERTAAVAAPRAPEPAATHLLVVSAGVFDPGPRAGRLSGLAAWRERSTNALGARPDADVPGGCAVSLWTGRSAAHHGVLRPDLALPSGAWTLAEAARAGGFATAAWLEAPFVSANRIEGFEQVTEEPQLETTPLVEELREFLVRRNGRTTLTWIHLAAPSPARLDHLASEIERVLEETGLAGETLALLAVFARDAEASLGEREAVLWIAPPEVGWGARKSPSPTNLSDVTGFVRELLRLPGPNPHLRQSELQSDTERMLAILRGWQPDGADAWVQSEDRAAWITDQGWTIVDDGSLRSVPESDDEARFAAFRAARELVERNRTTALPAHVPAGW